MPRSHVVFLMNEAKRRAREHSGDGVFGKDDGADLFTRHARITQRTLQQLKQRA